jgi:hypothetical protein
VTASLVVPSTAKPGFVVPVKAAGFDPSPDAPKWILTTVDANGVESGYNELGSPTNTNRPMPDGTFGVGIKMPTVLGDAKVRAYQPAGTKVAEATVKIATSVPVSGTALPSSIANATGTVDTQLRDWLMSLPDNATALLGSSQLRVANQIDLQGRGPLRVEGQTSEIRCINRTSVGIVRLSYGTHGIQWRGGAITGSNPVPGRRQAETYEHNHAFDVRGVVDLEVSGVRIRNVGGDFFYLAGGYVAGGAFRHAQDVRIHDNDCQGNGRMGVAMLDGLDGFEIWNNVMGGITWYSLDIENNGHIFNNIPAGVTAGKIHNNKFGPIPYGRNPQLAPLPGISSEPSGLSFTVTGASSGGVVVPVSNIDVSFNENTDPNWPDFRWGIYASGTSGVSVHDNRNQVKR